jgi:hypothetical protein
MISLADWFPLTTPPEPQHRSLSSSERQVRVLSAVVEPGSHLAVIAAAEFLQGSTIGPKSIGHDSLRPAIPLQRFLQESKGRLAISRLVDHAFQHLTLVIDGSPEVARHPIDLHETSSRCRCHCRQARIAWTRLPLISAANIGPNLFHQNRALL